MKSPCIHLYPMQITVHLMRWGYPVLQCAERLSYKAAAPEKTCRSTGSYAERTAADLVQILRGERFNVRFPTLEFPELFPPACSPS